MTYNAVTTGSTITNYSYNYTQNLTKEIMGLGMDGWGIGSQNSSQVTNRNKIKVSQWDHLIRDLNFIQTHITNANTSSVAPTTATAIGIALPNALGLDIDSLETQRHICHPSQFYGYPGDTVNIINGTSTRTTLWSKEISQQVRIDWPTNLFARYFFNAGSVLTWRANYLSVVGNDRDQEWGAFIDYLHDNADWSYDHTDWINTGTATKIVTYNSGTLTVAVSATRQGTPETAKRIDLTAVFRNEDIPDIVVSPTTGYWNYGPWEVFLNSTNTNHISGVQSGSGAYSAQSGFSLDRVNGNIMLYMGVWPSDPPNNQTCNWEWLAFNNNGLNKLGNDVNSNYYRIATQTRPYWTIGGSYDLTSIPLSSSVDFQIPNWPYTLVAYTFRITRATSTSVTIQTYPNAWGTGDTGSSISVENWWRLTNELWGYTPAVPPTYDGDGGVIDPGTPAVLGTGTFTW